MNFFRPSVRQKSCHHYLEMGEAYTRFLPETAQKPISYPDMEYIGVPPPPRHLTNPTLFVTPVLNYSCLIIIPSWLWDNTTPVTWSTDLHFKCPFTTDPEVAKQSRSETTIKNIIRAITEV